VFQLGKRWFQEGGVLSQSCLDVLDKADGVAVEQVGEVDGFSVLLSRDCPLSGVGDMLSASVRVSWFIKILYHFGLCLLVGDNELILLYVGAEVFSKGQLGICNNVQFAQ
jgi:hypothetical protein